MLFVYLLPISKHNIEVKITNLQIELGLRQ